MTSSEPRFERLRLIGEGATGRVELARLTATFGDLPVGTDVAVKTLYPERASDEHARAAFRAEAEAGRAVRDPSLVRVLHHDDEAELPYLLLQYVPGRSLREALVDGALPEPLVRSIGAQLAGALEALHGAGLAHGDVKPENVRLDDAGRAVLIDLGFACRMQEPGRPADARPDGERGSLAYLSPERAAGAPPDAAADVFALGVVLYELATGVHPFGFAALGRAPGTEIGWGSHSGALLRASLEEPDADRLLAAIARARLVPPSHLDATLTPLLDALLAEVLSRAPNDRPAAAELATRLRETESSSWWREQVDPRTRGRQRARAPGLRSQLMPLVGRDAELDVLARHLGEVRAGRPAVVWIGSPPGCGKWRLASEFAAQARTSDDPPIYLYARWSAAAEARPAGALLILLHRWLRLPIGDEPAEREERALEELVGRRRARTLLTALSSASPEDADPTPESVPEALAAWIAALGAERPVLLFLDELHRAEAVTLEAVSSLLDALDGRVLLLLGVRDDLEPVDSGLERLRARLQRMAAEGKPHPVAILSLAPLELPAMRELVERVFDRGVPRDRLAEVLWRRSRGNPGLVNEILVDLLADGSARRLGPEAGAPLELLVPPDELPLPRSLDRIVAERVRTLQPEDRRWLERLAVVGGRIDPPFLMRAFPPTGRAEIDEVLARLVRRGWLVPAANRYRFVRPALREVLYRSLGFERRRRMHLAAARGLEPEAPQGTGEAPTSEGVEAIFQRAFHLRAAGEARALHELVTGLIVRERQRTSARRLLTLARWGLEALEELEGELPVAERDRSRLELLETAADAADRLGRREEERELLDYLVDLDHDEHPAEGARLYLLHARYAMGTGRFGLARGMLKNAVELARSSGDPGLVSESLRRMSQVQGQIGELEEATAHAREALELANHPEQSALAYLALAHIDVLEDRLSEALEHIDTCVGILRDERDVSIGVAAYASLLRARVWRSLGRPERAYSAARRAVELARRKGERRLEAEARARLGGLLLDQDRPEEAEAQLRDAELLADEIEDRRGQVLARMFLGLLLHEEDDDRARGMIVRATDQAREIAFYRAESFGLAMQARSFVAGIVAHGGPGEDDLARADETSAAARELLERHGAELTDRIVILGTRALVLARLGKEGRSTALVRRLERRIERARSRLGNAELGAALRSYCGSLLRAALSIEGPVLPRR